MASLRNTKCFKGGPIAFSNKNNLNVLTLKMSQQNFNKK